jgi:hypothetical protein
MTDQGQEQLAASEETGGELRLEDCVSALAEANEKLDKEPSFATATDSCLASRVASGVFFSEWQAAGGCSAHLTERLRNEFSRAEKLDRRAAGQKESGTAYDRSLMERYADSIRFRRRMLDLLRTRGVAAVEVAVDKENERRIEGTRVRKGILSPPVEP